MREFFDGKEPGKKLVVAYLPGMPLQKDTFGTIPPGESSLQTGCFVSWSTFGRGIRPHYFTAAYHSAICSNPISWENKDEISGYEDHLGAVSPGYRKIHKQFIAAKSEQGVLWIRNRKPIRFCPLPLKNYVLMDFDLFYLNIRENVWQRIETWFARSSDNNK
jgi:hypothetical protein